MKLALLFVARMIAISLVASGCTSQQVYYAAQGWQRNECNRVIDQSERERCVSQANTTYEDYKRQTEDSKKQ